MYELFVFLHIAGALLFAAAHGVPGAVALAIRDEPDPLQLARLLELGAGARPAQYAGLALLLIGGIAAGWAGGWWQTGWIWLSLALLVLLLVGAVPLAIVFARLRRAIRTGRHADIERLRRSPLPLVVAGYETVGFLAIVWLMVAKPF
ncbi:MAG: DUF2269 family protein [Chloroflexota bacterium]|nr:DUF2269 family protein [Dehalococcoidia bacterium]MDW8253909.1 DUF2269 family protein [Chloroflexota bacterium]